MNTHDELERIYEGMLIRDHEIRDLPAQYSEFTDDYHFYVPINSETESLVKDHTVYDYGEEDDLDPIEYTDRDDLRRILQILQQDVSRQDLPGMHTEVVRFNAAYFRGVFDDSPNNFLLQVEGVDFRYYNPEQWKAKQAIDSLSSDAKGVFGDIIRDI